MFSERNEGSIICTGMVLYGAAHHEYQLWRQDSVQERTSRREHRVIMYWAGWVIDLFEIKERRIERSQVERKRAIDWDNITLLLLMFRRNKACMRVDEGTSRQVDIKDNESDQEFSSCFLLISFPG